MISSCEKLTWTRCGKVMSNERKPVQELEYSAGLMSQCFWFIEMKKMIQLKAAGKTDEEIKQECLENNLLGAVKEYRAKRMFGYLWNRINLLDEELIRLFLEGYIITQKLVNLIGILRGDKLFFEFVYEVYREKAILGQLKIEDVDTNLFFRNKENQSPVIENWNESTKKKLKNFYLCSLADAGLLKVEKKDREITLPIVDKQLATHLITCGDKALLIAITGVA